MERRKSSRVRCQYPCEILRPKQGGQGTILDLSQGGLCLRSQVELDAGEQLLLRIPVAGEPLEVEAMVWHSRRVKRRDTGQVSWLVGLMLVRAPDAYLELLPAAGAEDEAAPSPAEGTALGTYRIRVQQRAGSLTRVLSLSAESRDEARSLALTALGHDWDVLEVKAA
jgi:hypothetical protein